MNSDEPDEASALNRIVHAISSETPLDWEAERAATPEIEAVLPTLQALERIVHAHRAGTIDSEGDPGEPEVGTAFPVADAVPPFRWGSLEVRGRLGVGSFGEVFRAFDPKLEREVALKLILPGRLAEGFATRFLEEARRLARVRHPNVLLVHGADEHDGRPGMWTDLVEGRTLEQILRTDGTFAPHEAAAIGMLLCRALAAVHGAGLVHADLKASNVVREAAGRIVLMDFGAVRDTAEPERVWESGQGSRLSMAPEQLRGEPASVASDLYALGVLLFRLTSGRFPVQAETWDELRELQDRAPAPSLLDVRPDVPAEFARVVECALAKRPERRFATAGAMERALASCFGEPGPAPGTPGPRAAGAGHAGRVAWIGGALIVATGAWAIFTDHGGPVRRAAQPGASVPGDPNTGPPDGTAGSGGAPPGPSALDTRPLLAEARLTRFRGGRMVPLAAEAAIRPGDALDLEVSPNEAMHVYVIDRDDEGRAFVLFPMAGLDRGNPLPGGGSVELPGSVSGRPFHWRVSSPGGRERIFVVGSRQPIAELEQAMEALPHPRAAGSTARRDSSGTPRLRGIGELVEDVRPRPVASPISLTLDHLRKRAADERGLWLWEIELRGPR